MSNEYRNIYLDHSATTPVDKRVVSAMLPYFSENYGNPSSIHFIGQRATQAINKSREKIASIINCQPDEIVFTSGGTESDNLAIRGLASKIGGAIRNSILISSVEHSAVTKTAERIASKGEISLYKLKVDKFGSVKLQFEESNILPQVAMVSIIYASSEIGTIQPIKEIAGIAKKHNILVHTDAVQAVGQLKIDVDALGVDMLSASAHKFYGPKGIGFLYVRRGTELNPILTGGGQELDRRSGTHNVPLIVGMAKALEIANLEQSEIIAHYKKMRDLLIQLVLEKVENVILTGHIHNRLYSHASFIFPHLNSQAIVQSLSINGIASSSGTACNSRSVKPSSVLLALGYQPMEAMGSLRLTVGRSTTEQDIVYTVEILRKVVEDLYRLQSLENKIMAWASSQGK